MEKLTSLQKLKSLTRWSLITTLLPVVALFLLSCSSPSSDNSSAVNAAATLDVSPTSTTISPGSTLTVTASNGSAPYSFILVNGVGSVSASGLYTATTVGTAEVEVQDANGNTGYCNITVSNSSGIVLSPQNQSLALYGSLTFTASGGVAPYTYAVTSGYGTFSGSTYTATGTASTVTISVTDSTGSMASTYIYVGSGGSTGDGNVEIISSYFSTELTGYNSQCTSANAFSGACSSAIDRYCRNNSYESGFGPMQVSGDSVTFTCMTNQDVIPINTNYSTLQGFDPSCGTDGNPVSSACKSAAFRLCKAQGYNSGYGPVQYGNGDQGTAVVDCVGPAATVITGGTFVALEAYNTGCTLANANSLACNNAVYQYCVANDYVSGFGLNEFSGNSATFTCVK